MAMKARLANKIRTTLYKRRLETLTDKEKVDIFDMIHKENLLMHQELNNYKSKRKWKKKINDERIARGWVKKKKVKINLESKD